MMSARSSLSDGDVDSEMTVADGNCRQLMSTDDSDQVKPVWRKTWLSLRLRLKMT